MECPLENSSGAELMVAYGAGALSPETEAALETHLAVCVKCREMAAAQKAVWSALDVWTPVPVSANFDQQLYQRIAAEERGAWWRRLFRANWSWRPAMPVAAACAVLIAAFLLKSPAPKEQPQSENPPKLQIEQVEHALDDIDMLKQLGVESVSDKARSSEQM
jgi:anti-sigma factor RsiW